MIADFKVRNSSGMSKMETPALDENLRIAPGLSLRGDKKSGLDWLAPHPARIGGTTIGLLVLGNPHPVERAIDEDERDHEEERADAGFQGLVFHCHGDFHREQ